MVDFLLVGVRFIVGLADTLGNDLRITLLVASVFAVCALHAGRIFEEIAAERTAHDVVELLSDEFVTLFLVDLFLALTNGTLTVETDIVHSAVFHLFGYCR